MKTESGFIGSGSTGVKLGGLILFAAFVFSSPFSARADELLPSEVKVSTPNYSFDLKNFTPPRGKYFYTVSWQGIPAADIEVSVEREGLNHLISTEVKTYKAIDLFYKLRYRAEGELSGVDLSPIRASFFQSENSRIKTTEITFDPDGTIKATRERVDKGKLEQVSFHSENFTLDPFSAAYVARAVHWKEGLERQFDTFNGKSRYLITLTAIDRATLPWKGESRPVWVIEPKVSNLTNRGKGSKLRNARIYLSDDNEREVLLIKSEVFIGTVKTKLDDFVPSTKASPGPKLVRAN